jgi:FixJ family two-component response regulator
MPHFIPVIALVENDLPANRAFVRLLRAYGYTVEPYDSAEAFLARGTGGNPDCMLLDIDLDGMSGLDLLQQLRVQADPLPVVFLTGRLDPATRSKAGALGCSAFLQKPVEGHQLVAAIEHAVEAAAQASPSDPSKGA